MGYKYEIKIRGVNRILEPSFQIYSKDSINDIKHQLNDDNNFYKFVEGEWTSPVITEYTCFQNKGAYFHNSK